MTGTQPQNRRLGYARVSTYGQTLDAQLERLRAEGCTKIYREKASGAQSERRELKSLLKALEPGDMVTVTRIDRLARSTFDLTSSAIAHERSPRSHVSDRETTLRSIQLFRHLLLVILSALLSTLSVSAMRLPQKQQCFGIQRFSISTALYATGTASGRQRLA